MSKDAIFETTTQRRVLALQVQAPYNRTKNIPSYFDEFLNLIKTNGIVPDVIETIKLRNIDSVTFITRGKLADLREVCKEHNIEEVIVSDPLTAQQEKNLEDYLTVAVFDRTQLILEIFEKSAHSAEGKAQVELAMLQHQKSRLSGKGIHLAQQRGGIGLRSGAGETLKERERRHIDTLILRIKRQLTSLEMTRTTQRKKRLSNKIPLVCLVGYTNAGKSTILNTLTKSDVLAEDKLFATLDTTTRELFIPPHDKVLVSDTVGFIQLLPPKLVEAFKSTLTELNYADLLLHVIDVSDSNWKEQAETVQEVLTELEVDKPSLYVFNKMDKLSHPEEIMMELELYKPNVLINGTSKEGIKPLQEYIRTWYESR